MRVVALVCVSAMVVAGGVQHATITMEDGTQHIGELVGESPEAVRLQQRGGFTRSIPKNQIEHI